MDPGTSVPLHSHNGKEYILVLDGSFCDEYGEYNKGDMQINDQKSNIILLHATKTVVYAYQLLKTM